MSTRSVLFGFGAVVLAAVPGALMAGFAGAPQRPVAFSVYLDPLPRPGVPFCPDCSALPGTTGTKVTVKVPTVQTAPTAPTAPAPRSTAR